MPPKRNLRRAMGCKPNQEQKTLLLEYLEKNPDLLEGEMMSHHKFDRWNELADELNAFGCARKTGAKWLKYWYDQRSYIRDRCSELHTNNNVRKKPNNSSTSCDLLGKPRKLNDYELRVMALTIPEFDRSIIEPMNKSDNQDECEPQDANTHSDDNFSTESVLSKVKLEWDSDDARSTPQRDYSRKPKQMDGEDNFAPEMLAEVNIKSESNTDIIVTSPVPTLDLPFVSMETSQPNDDQIDVPLRSFPEENHKSECNRPKNKNSSNRFRSFILRSTRAKAKRDTTTSFCENCRSKTYDREIQLKILEVMKASDKFNREMEMKKLQVEEKKVEALNRLIDVVQNGFDRIN